MPSDYKMHTLQPVSTMYMMHYCRLCTCVKSPNYQLVIRTWLLYICSAAACLDGDIRLMDGPSEVEGRVEVCFGNQWFSICDSGFDNRDASVACRQLGYSRYRELRVESFWIYIA